jgi:4'-phosphopantetheinyl transferase EntD
VTGLQREIAALLPDDVAVAGGAIDAAADMPFPAETAALERAVDERRREFSMGRTYARQALAMLGCPPGPIPVGSDRRAVWPEGFVGSISHSRRLCAAIAARSSRYVGLGLDLEDDAPIDDEGVRAQICRPEEARDGVDRTKLLFVIKEAVFKAYYPESGAFLEFADVSVTIDPTLRSFVATLVRPELPRLAGLAAFAGGFRCVDGHVMAAVAIARG